MTTRSVLAAAPSQSYWDPISRASGLGYGWSRNFVVVCSLWTGSRVADLYEVTREKSSFQRVRQKIELAPRKARLVPCSRSVCALARICTDQYSSWPSVTSARDPANSEDPRCSAALVV